jgi:outer membrane receptor protein involved in Fe transport
VEGRDVSAFCPRAKLRGLLSLAVLLAAASSVSLAQSGLEISVVDEASGRALPGVEIQLVNEDIGLDESALSDEHGKVRFVPLSTAGAYHVVAPGGSLYEAFESDPVRLRATRISSLTVALRPKSAGVEEVDVVGRARAAKVNTIDAEVSSTLLPREITQIPIEGRDITRALYRLPNVTQATGFFPEAPNVSINGANGLYTNYMIDGLDNNENFLGGQKFPVPTGFVQDVTVLTNTYSAEYGRTGNGIFNITSRSGSNELSGEVFFITRPGQPLDADSEFASRDLSGNAVKRGFERQQFGVGVGGPIVENQTFYYFNYERTGDDKDNVLTSPDLGVNTTIPGENDFEYVSGKIDHYWSDQLRSTLRVNSGDATIERQGGGLDGGVLFPSASSTQRRDSFLSSLQTTYTSKNMVSETNIQFGTFDWGYVDPNNGPSAQASLLGPDELTDAIVGHPGWTFDSREESIQLQQKFTWFIGDHTVKAGAEMISSSFDLEAGGNPNGNYQVKLTESQLATLRDAGLGANLNIQDIASVLGPENLEVLNYNVELREAAFGETQNIYGLWVEDAWSVTPRLNLTLGLRYDWDSLSEGASDSSDTDNWAPRLSANYQLDESSVLRFGAGMFYDKIVYAIYSDALQQNTRTEGYATQIRALVDRGLLPADTRVDEVLFDGNVVASFRDEYGFLAAPTAEDLQGQEEQVFSNERRILNPNGYQNPYTVQFTAGYQRQLRNDLLFYVDLIYNRGYHLPRLRNLNAPEPWIVTPQTPPSEAVRTPEEADATRPLADLGAIPGGARNIVMTEMQGESEYRAANFTLLKDRAGDWYSYRLTYTLSQLENNTDDINFRAADSNRFEREWGPSLNDRTHVFNTLFQVHPSPSWTFSLAGLVQSGQPANRIPDATIYGTADLNGDGRLFGDSYVGNNDRSPGESRNSDRLPWSQVFDLGVAYELPLGTGNLELRMDVFNVFNEENLSGYANNATQSNQIQVGPSTRGIVKRNEGPRRQFQFGARYVF